MMNTRSSLSFLLVLTMTACSTPGSWYAKNSLRHIEIVAAADANQSSPTSIDIVFAMSEDSASELPNTSLEWYQGRSSFLGILGSNVSVVTLELPPAKTVDDIEFPENAWKARSIVLYADYLDKNSQLAFRLERHRRVAVYLNRNSVEIMELDK